MYDPGKRITAKNALKHPYFEGVLETLPVAAEGS